ncbi:hypothetical protein HOLleu_34687 [Holothuria leucospilota]|uniref:Reverse transcriptase zinc-binding domain-containing protein n=1 Tax=Holothuria leucospilota TaxID=206669 RepID=A0A9Q1BHA8_HOLLE|nr:hypothetical protein HOLleu_34687 [Holothuria leucospilota]
MDDPDVDTWQTNQWLRSAGLKAETGGLIVAAQDQSLATRAYLHRKVKDGTNPLCRLCGQYKETIDHIISGCPVLAPTEYTHRHNKVATYIHWLICRHYGIETSTDKWYDHQPLTVSENQDATILWDMPVHTDREIKANRPDIVVKDFKEKKCLLIDVAVPSDKNISIKTTEKLSKYKDLEIEICRMWQMKTETVPVVVGALGMCKKGMNAYLNKLPGQIDMNLVQKTALLGTAHILRKMLSIK